MASGIPTFLWQFARRPGTTGAICPSSGHLGRVMLDGLGIESADVVFELGSGTGAFTELILERLKPGARFVAVEINPVMIRHLRRRFPDLSIMTWSAHLVHVYRRRNNIGPVDCVVSGLPWAVFSSRLQDKIIGSIVENLRPGGQFATFAYLHSIWTPAARRFRRKLIESFGGVRRTDAVWRNIPPALVYHCHKGSEAPASWNGSFASRSRSIGRSDPRATAPQA